MLSRPIRSDRDGTANTRKVPTMSDIVLSAGVRSNLLNLQQTSELITSTQTRLATGKRVNSALDSPNNYFTAQGLDNRANDLSNLLDSSSNAIKDRKSVV